MLWQVLYNIALKLISFILPVLAIWNSKLKHFLHSRKLFFEKDLPIKNPSTFRIWMHCASLGEYEQGKPALILFRKKHPEVNIVLSFFSPSGFENVKADDLIDHVVYLPIDGKFAAEKFIKVLNPDLAIFVKYDFWYNHLQYLVEEKIPTVFLSLIIHKDHFLLKSYGRFIRKILKRIDHIFVQDKNSYELLSSFGFDNISISGDTRVDSSYENTKVKYEDPHIDQFLNDDRKCIVAGSLWEKDLGLIAALDEKVFSSYKWLIVPHETDAAMLDMVEKLFKKQTVLRYSNSEENQESNLMLIDQKGILKYLYKNAYLVYIGGGFGKGIHNTLEPAAYSLPVIFGPEYTKFMEAKALVEAGGFFVIDSVGGLKSILNDLEDLEKYNFAKRSVATYIKEGRGASQLVMDYLERFWRYE